MSSKVARLKMLRDLTNNNELKVLIDVLLEILNDSKETMGFKDGKRET